MSEPIKVGDLVVVIKPTHCCNGYNRVGQVHRIISDHDRLPLVTCRICGFTWAHDNSTTAHIGGGVYLLRTRLKRIPPLSELEGQRTEETLREPA